MKRAFLTILTVCLLLTLALSAANADSLKGGKEKTSAVLLSTKDYAKFIEPYFSMNTFALGSYQQDWYYLVAPSDGEYTFSFKKQAGSWILAVYKDPQGIVDQIEITENRELYKIKAKKGEEIYLGFYINIGYIDFNAGGDFSVCFDGYHNVHETRYTLEEALCEKEGTIVTGICSICGQITATETIPATGHTPGKEVVLTEPTCIQEGLKGIQCTVCKTVLSSEIIPTADHKPGKFETIVEPTCTNEGLSRQTCIVCHEILSEKPVPAAGHQPGEWNVLTQPTCTEEGIRARTCSVCGEVLEMDAVPALGHSFGSWTVTQMPTAAEPGIQSRTCSRCGETEMKALVLQTSGDSQEQMNVSKENITASTNDAQGDKTAQAEAPDADVTAQTEQIPLFESENEKQGDTAFASPIQKVSSIDISTGSWTDIQNSNNKSIIYILTIHLFDCCAEPENLELSWTDSYLKESDYERNQRFQMVKEKNTFCSVDTFGNASTSVLGYSIWIELPDDPSIQGEQSCSVQIGNELINITFKLDYMGNYTDGSGWSAELITWDSEPIRQT